MQVKTLLPLALSLHISNATYQGLLILIDASSISTAQLDDLHMSSMQVYASERVVKRAVGKQTVQSPSILQRCIRYKGVNQQARRENRVKPVKQ